MTINQVLSDLDIETRNYESYVFMGGTFDPIHNGHLRTAVDVVEKLDLKLIHLLPCAQPVHKNIAIASAEQRLDMLRLSVQSEQRLRIDTREINRSTPSYTIDSLIEIRNELGQERPVIMVLGMDSFLSLPSWSRWEALLNYAHIMVICRPGWPLVLGDTLTPFFEKYRAHDKAELQCCAAGKIWLDTLTPLNISSSLIRNLSSRHKSIAYLLPESVQDYIDSNLLYR